MSGQWVPVRDGDVVWCYRCHRLIAPHRGAKYIIENHLLPWAALCGLHDRPEWRKQVVFAVAVQLRTLDN